MQSQDIRQLLATAIAHHQAGRIDQAEPLYRRILAAMPQQVDALHLSGVIASQKGDYEAAVSLIGRALAVNANVPHFHNNIGAAYRPLKQLDKAVAHFRKAIALKPDYAEAHQNLGAALHDLQRMDEAVAAFNQAVVLKPDYAKAHYGLGLVRQTQKRWDEALDHYGRALAYNAGYIDALNNTGVILKEQGKLKDAAARHERALALKPDHAHTHYNLGLVREEEGRLDEALSSYAQAQTFAPDEADAHWNEALIRLLRGEYERGWRQYEWRHKRSRPAPPRDGMKRWQGEDLRGRAILLQAEQGYGDTIQFVRYAAILKARGAKVAVACQAGLPSLIQTATGVDEVIDWDAPCAADFYIPLLSLPGALATTTETIPGAVPYLRAAPERLAAWRGKFAAPGRNIGLVWRGNPGNSINHKKSIPLDALAPLLATPGVNWSIIQADATADEIAQLSAHGTVEARGPALTDWAETAALISALDLVISVDTGVAHLAGALGARVWVPLSFIPDWRWLLDRPDSPWYPTARLYRQPSFGDWPAVIGRLRADLAALAGTS
ncbi:MAG: tetratricopeptide repeat protein [Rhodospirillaceae bacterium]|nr:tetratricopeptide repeat protein [Rhodospirillaceae bacterium]